VPREFGDEPAKAEGRAFIRAVGILCATGPAADLQRESRIRCLEFRQRAYARLVAARGKQQRAAGLDLGQELGNERPSRRTGIVLALAGDVREPGPRPRPQEYDTRQRGLEDPVTVAFDDLRIEFQRAQRLDDRKRRVWRRKFALDQRRVERLSMDIAQTSNCPKEVAGIDQ